MEASAAGHLRELAKSAKAGQLASESKVFFLSDGVFVCRVSGANKVAAAEDRTGMFVRS